MVVEFNIEEKFEELIQIAPVRPAEAYAISKDLLENYTNRGNYFEKAIIQAANAFSGQFLGYYAEAFNLANEALIIFEEKQHLKYQAFVYNTLGFIFNYLNDLENRLKVNLKSLQLRKSIGDSDGYMRSLNNTGDTYCKMGEYSKALEYFNLCLEITPEDNLRMLAVVNCNLGEVHYLLGNFKRSQHFLDRSETFARAIDFSGILFTVFLYQAKLKIDEKNYSVAIQILESETNHIDLEKEMDDIAPLFKELGLCHEKIGNADKALFNYKIYYALQEKMRAEKYDSEIRRIQFNYEINSLQNQKEQLEALVYERTVELESAFTALQTKDKTNEAILESAIDGVVLINADGKIEKANRIFREKLSMNKTSDFGNFVFDFLEFVDGTDFEDFISNLFKNSENIVKKQFILQSKHNEKPTLYFRVNFNQIQEQYQNLGLIFLNDITFQLKLEEERKNELESEKTINIFAQSLFNENTVDGVLWSLTKNCMAHLGFYECVVYLVDPINNILIQKAAHGPKNPSERHINNPINIKIGKGIVGTVALTGNYEKIADTSKDSRYIVDDEIRLSEIAVPILRNNEIIGVIDSEHPDPNFFTDRHLRILTTVSRLVANRIDKLKEQEAKERLQQELVVLNNNLEKEVRSKTKENTELARKVFEQEQKAIFGELTKSVAHELNTPIAIIKSGVEAINYQIGEACNGFTSSDLTQSDLQFVRRTVLKGIIPIQRFGLEESKKLKHIQSILKEHIDQNETFEELAQWILKTQLTAKEDIEEILVLNAPLFALKLLHSIQQINGFSHSVVTSIDTAISVVNEIKSIHHYDQVEKRHEFHLYDVIHSILETDINLNRPLNWNNSIHQNCSISGQELKIKQMFTMLIQFVIAHSVVEDDKHIVFSSESKDDAVCITMDFPVQSIDEILEKDLQYSSQHSSQPTEKLKLNLVLTILQEHNAALKFDCDNQLLKCTVRFQKR
jgi:putative methionine-R-sulfoxide reductase with GAF domain/PAS domain-containing protein